MCNGSLFIHVDLQEDAPVPADLYFHCSLSWSGVHSDALYILRERERGDRKEIMRNGRSGHMRAGDCWVWEKEQEVKDITVSKVRVWCVWVFVYVIHMLVWEREWMNERIAGHVSVTERASELHSCACIFCSEQSVPAVLRDRAVHHVTPLRCSSAMEPDS